MKRVFVVDEDANGLASDLNGIARRDGLDFEFAPFVSPVQMFQELENGVPELILLHHHWPGLEIASLLERIGTVAEDTRVIVFTGRSVDVAELIACVRFGVVTYWTRRGELDVAVVFNQIADYCSRPEWTLRRLKMPSGSVLQLLQGAESSLEQVAVLERVNQELRLQLKAVRTAESRVVLNAIVSVGKFVSNAVVLTGSFILIGRYTAFPTWAALALVAIIALFFLFLEGRLAKALFKWKGGSAGFTGK